MKEREKIKEQIVLFIKEYQQTNSISPTFREIGDAVKLKSSASVYNYLEELKDDGVLTYIAKRPRTIRLTGDSNIASESVNDISEENNDQKNETRNEAEILYHAVIKGTPITKKNSQEIRFNKKTGARWIAQSKAYEAYAQAAGFYLKGEPMIDEPVNVQMVFYMPTNRRVDLSNLQSACLDILVDYHILADDRCGIVIGHDLSRVVLGTGQENARTEITITRG